MSNPNYPDGVTERDIDNAGGAIHPGDECSECGHKITESDEGTCFCECCELNARNKELKAENASLKAKLEVAVEALDEYGNHEDGCIRLRLSAGEPTEGGGYRQKYDGKWYQSNPVDETPKCRCGFDEALAKIRESK